MRVEISDPRRISTIRRVQTEVRRRQKEQPKPINNSQRNIRLENGLVIKSEGTSRDIVSSDDE